MRPRISSSRQHVPDCFCLSNFGQLFMYEKGIRYACSLKYMMQALSAYSIPSMQPLHLSRMPPRRPASHRAGDEPCRLTANHTSIPQAQPYPLSAEYGVGHEDYVLCHNPRGSRLCVVINDQTMIQSGSGPVRLSVSEQSQIRLRASRPLGIPQMIVGRATCFDDKTVLVTRSTPHFLTHKTTKASKVI